MFQDTIKIDFLWQFRLDENRFRERVKLRWFCFCFFLSLSPFQVCRQFCSEELMRQQWENIFFVWKKKTYLSNTSYANELEKKSNAEKATLSRNALILYLVLMQILYSLYCIKYINKHVGKRPKALWEVTDCCCFCCFCCCSYCSCFSVVVASAVSAAAAAAFTAAAAASVCADVVCAAVVYVVVVVVVVAVAVLVLVIAATAVAVVAHTDAAAVPVVVPSCCCCTIVIKYD